MEPKFGLGQIVATPAALEMARTHNLNLGDLLARHASGDWGDMDAHDKQENDFAVDKCLRIFSSYNTPGGKLWIITEADRSATTFTLPEDY